MTEEKKKNTHLSCPLDILKKNKESPLWAIASHHHRFTYQLVKQCKIN
jgi:hypothetical protein